MFIDVVAVLRKNRTDSSGNNLIRLHYSNKEKEVTFFSTIHFCLRHVNFALGVTKLQQRTFTQR